MSQKVQAELKEEIELSRDKEFICHDITEEVCEEDCHDTLDSYRDIDQGKWKWNFVATFLTLSRQSMARL